MGMRSLRLALVLALLSGPARTADADVASDLSAAHTRIQTAFRALDTAYRREIEARASDPASGRILLRIEEALTHDGSAFRPLEVELVRSSQGWTSASAVSPGWNQSAHEVDPSGLRREGDRLHGILKVRLISDGWVPPEDASVAAEFALSARVEGDAVRGTYRMTLPEGRATSALVECVGDLSGRVRRPAPPQAFELPALPPAPADPEGRRVWAVQAEQDADRLYLAARTMRRGLAGALGYEEAREVTEGFAAVRGADASVAAVAARLVAMAQALEETAAGTGGGFASGSVETPDRRFGPFYRLPPLPPGPLPGGLPRPGAQRWAHLRDWQVLGPLPQDPRPDLATPRLPDLLAPATGERVIPVRGDPQGEALAWRALTANDEGFVDPGIKEGGFFAVTTLESPEAQTVWLALRLNPRMLNTHVFRGRAWLNGRQIWASWLHDVHEDRNLAILPVTLEAGPNRLEVRVWSRGQTGGDAGFLAAIALQGSPLDAGAAQARDEEAERLADAARAKRASIRGFLNQATARYPDARPPVAWDWDARTNVAWVTPMPGFSTSQPLVVGDLLLTTAHPRLLLALDKHTGEIRWRTEVEVLDTFPPEVKAEALRLRAAGEAGPYKEFGVRHGLDYFDFDDLADRGFRDGHWQAYSSVCPTPVSDGIHVWVKLIEGAVACYDLEGSQVWIRHLPMPGHRALASLVLIDGILMVDGVRDPPWRGAPETKTVVGLDAATGQERWRAEVVDPKQGIATGFTNLASSVPVTVSDGTTARTLLVTGASSLVDPRDGRVLAFDMRLRTGGTRYGQGTPNVHRSQVFFPQMARQTGAAEIMMADPENLGFRKLWHVYAHHNGYGAVWFDGRLYDHSWYFGPMPHRGHYPFAEMLVLDAETGRQLHLYRPYDRRIASSTTFPTITATAEFLYAGSSRSDPDLNRPGQGTMTVIRPGLPPYVVARNWIPGTGVAPVPDGDRLYLRGFQEVVCIGFTGDAGRDYEIRTLAKTLFDDLPEIPDAGAWTRPRPSDPEAVGDPAPEPVIAGALPRAWQFAGPFPADRVEALRARLGNLAELVSMAAVTVGEGEEAKGFAPLPEAVRQDDALNLLAATGNQRGVGGFLFTTLHTRRKLGVQFDLRGSTSRAWLGGHPLDHRGKAVLEPGVYPLLVEFTIPRALPFPRFAVRPAFTLVDDPDAVMVEWAREVDARRHDLERIQEMLTLETPEARRARDTLVRARRILDGDPDAR